MNPRTETTRARRGFLLLLALLLAGATVQAQEPAPRTLSLDEAVRLALDSDEQIQQMAETLTAAQADVLAAGADRLPQVALSGNWKRNIKKPAFFLPPDFAAAFGGASSVEAGRDWDLQAAATVTLNLWTAGRLSSARAMAEQGVEATRWQEALARDAVRFSVTQAYWDLLLAHEQVRIAEQALALARENKRVTEAAFDEGNASRFELLRADVELTNREAPLVQAQNQRRLAELNLLRRCGLEPGTPLDLSTTLDEVRPPAPEADLIARMHDASPELRALEHSVKAAQWSTSLARAGRGPMVRLQGTYAVQGEWDDDLFPGGDETAGSLSAALGVSWPIFDGFATKAAVQSSEAQLRVARLEYERTVRDRELGVRQARTNLENARLALEGRREGVQLATEAHRLAVIRKENGLATPLELLDAELALTEARVQLAAALHDVNIAAARLELAVGGSEEN